jgi:glycosyltransferase involved in cell wall biosynthesis
MSEREKASCPLVSIITPAYNRADYLAETIDSVLGQDYPFIEYIVLDDGSTDNTREVLSRYDGRIVWETHPNMGEARTVNRALEMSRGDIIVVVNSDDPLRPGAISRAVAEFASWQDLLAVYGDWVEIDPNSVDIRRVHVPQFDLATMMLSSNISLGPGTFFRRCVLAVVGMRDTSFRYVGDLDYWFRVAAHGPLRHVPEVLATHRTHPSAISFAERGRLMAAELVAVVQKVFADPELPTGIRRMRRAAVGNAHLSAAMACGGDDRARIEHLCRAFVYAPALTLRRVAALVAAWLYRHAPRPIAGILRRVWHARRKRHMLRSREGESPRRQ